MALAHFGHLLEVGYNQLYFLIVIMEFYLLFPLVLWLLRRTKGHHGLVLAAAVAAQFAMAIGMHWKLLPDVVVAYGQENAACYVLYLLGGAIVAFHLSDVHDWVVRNAPLVIYLTVASAIFAEAVYYLSREGFTHILGYGSDPFQPSVIPFNVCVIALGYLAGMYLVRPWRSRRTKAAVRIGSDNAYGIYLAQMIFITSLGALGWTTFVGRAPFYVWLPLTVAIASSASCHRSSSPTSAAVTFNSWRRRRSSPLITWRLDFRDPESGRCRTTRATPIATLDDITISIIMV